MNKIERAKRDAKIVAMAKQGIHADDIAVAFDISTTCVRVAVAAAGEKLVRKPYRGSGRPPQKPERDQKVIRLYRDGKSLIEIAKQFGVSKARIHQIVLRYRKGGTTVVPQPLAGECTLKQAHKWGLAYQTLRSYIPTRTVGIYKFVKIADVEAWIKKQKVCINCGGEKKPKQNNVCTACAALRKTAYNRANSRKQYARIKVLRESKK